MLDEDEVTLGFEHPLHLQERQACIGNRAERPRRHDRVDGPVPHRDALGRSLDELDRKRRTLEPRPRQRPQLAPRVDAMESLDGAPVESDPGRPLLRALFKAHRL